MPTTLHPYRTDLPHLFEMEKGRICTVLKHKDIHHVGSSSIPGLYGKNIVDILIGLEKFDEELDEVLKKLNKLGYITGFIEKEKKWAYLKNKENCSEGDFHIHVVQKNTSSYKHWFLFRDYLLSHSEEREICAQLKKQWLTQSKGVGMAYAKLKTKYIHSILEKAGKESYKLFLVCGPPFSGKTTLAKSIAKLKGYHYISTDEIMKNRGFDLAHKIRVEEWEEVHQECFKIMRELMKQKVSIVLDDTNYLRGLRDRFRDIAVNFGYSVITIYVNTPLKILNARREKVRKSLERPYLEDNAFLDVVNNFEIPGRDENTIIYNSFQEMIEWINIM